MSDVTDQILNVTTNHKKKIKRKFAAHLQTKCRCRFTSKYLMRKQTSQMHPTELECVFVCVCVNELIHLSQ